MVFWHPKGWSIYTAVEKYMREKQVNANYSEIKTPQVIDRKLWEKSGHWEKYRENMFITEIDEEHANEKRTNALKPMNCPGHVQIYNQSLKSYRDLPIRFAEFGSCHRYEPSGTMHGLMRVRASLKMTDIFFALKIKSKKRLPHLFHFFTMFMKILALKKLISSFQQGQW